MQRLPTRWTRAQIAQYEAGYEMGEHDARLKATGGTIRPPQSTRPSGDLCPVFLGWFDALVDSDSDNWVLIEQVTA
jgi:hypothetical protein